VTSLKLWAKGLGTAVLVINNGGEKFGFDVHVEASPRLSVVVADQSGISKALVAPFHKNYCAKSAFFFFLFIK